MSSEPLGLSREQRAQSDLEAFLSAITPQTLAERRAERRVGMIEKVRGLSARTQITMPNGMILTRETLLELLDRTS